MTTNINTKPLEFVASWNAFRNALPACPKTSTNPHFKNKFTPLDTWVDNSLIAATAANFAIVETTKLLVANDTLYQVHCVDVIGEHGSTHSEYVIGELDTKPQANGSALTYARRYHLQVALGATGEEDDDAEVAQAAPRTAVTMGTARARRGTVA